MADTALDVLFLASFDGSNASSIADFLFSFNAYSRHRIFYVLDCRRLEDVDLSAFDVVVVFWSASLLGPDLGAAVRARLRSCGALKAVFLQDEFGDVRRLDAALAEIGAQLLFTCVAERDHETFYPASLIPTLEARYTVLPSYVPASLENRAAFGRARPLDVGYRSRVAPFYLGDLARSKRLVAERFESACGRRGLRADISVRELSRLYGVAWVSFLGRCRCVLGSPSGASVIDFDGEIRKGCERHLARHPETSYEEVRDRFFPGLDGRFVVDTVSARIFESVALGCTLVHVEGEYAGVLEPGRHYIPVRRDLSNVEEVLDRVQDPALCRRVAEAAHTDLVASGRYSFRTFVEGFDRRLESHVPRAAGRAPGRTVFHARRALLHGPPFLPFRAGFLALPVHGSLLALRRLSLGALRPGPLAGRFLRNPGAFLGKTMALAWLFFRCQPIRALLRLRRREESLRAAVPLWQLLEDLLKLDVALRAISGLLRSPLPFTVEVGLDPEDGTLLLTSVPGDGVGHAAPPGLEEAIRLGGVRQVIWDHSELAREVTLSTGCRWMTLSLGTGGVHRFEALSALCHEAPALAAKPLVALLDPGASRPGPD